MQRTVGSGISGRGGMAACAELPSVVHAATGEARAARAETGEVGTATGAGPGAGAGGADAPARNCGAVAKGALVGLGGV